jgi:hypothetical protein
LSLAGGSSPHHGGARIAVAASIVSPSVSAHSRDQAAGVSSGWPTTLRQMPGAMPRDRPDEDEPEHAVGGPIAEPPATTRA